MKFTCGLNRLTFFLSLCSFVFIYYKDSFKIHSLVFDISHFGCAMQQHAKRHTHIKFTRNIHINMHKYFHGLFWLVLKCCMYLNIQAKHLQTNTRSLTHNFFFLSRIDRYDFLSEFDHFDVKLFPSLGQPYRIV